MSDLSLIQTPAQFLEAIKVDAMPNGNLSTRGVARCCGVARAAIIDGGHFKSQKLAQILSEHGFEAGHLSSDGFPPQAVWLCIEYFAYESKAKAEGAKQLARTFGSIGVMTTLQQLQDSKSFPESTIGQVEKDPALKAQELIANAIDLIFAPTGMDKTLIAGIKLEAMSTQFPECRPALAAAKKELLLPIESKLLTPTELAEIWQARTGECLTAIAMNKRLESANLQRKTGGKNPSWESIGRGIDHSLLVAETAKGHGKTVQHLRWYESVLDLI